MVRSYFIQLARHNIAELYDLHHFESDAEHLEFIDFILADNKDLFPVADCVEGGVHRPNPMVRESKAASELPVSTLHSGGRNPGYYLHQILLSCKLPR